MLGTALSTTTNDVTSARSLSDTELVNVTPVSDSKLN